MQGNLWQYLSVKRMVGRSSIDVGVKAKLGCYLLMRSRNQSSSCAGISASSRSHTELLDRACRSNLSAEAGD